MELRLRDTHEFVDQDFTKWLILRIEAKLIANIDTKRLYVWDKYLTTSDSLKRLYDKPYRAEEYLILAARNLVYSGNPGDITISINKNLSAPGFDRVKLYDLVKLINYGNLNTKGYALFSNIFFDIADNINSYLELYYRL